MKRYFILYALLFVAGNADSSVYADKIEANSSASRAKLNWITEYDEAYQRAERGRRMLLVYFRGDQENNYRDEFESKSLSDERVVEKLQDYVLAKVATDATITVGGEEIRLLNHAAYDGLDRKEGLAVVDLSNRDTEHFGHVVSVVPLTRGRYYRFEPDHVAVLLDLPAGTLTQRTMIFAVRIHPEAPESTVGKFNGALAEGAADHSQHQARIRVQGHHNWGSRFQHLSSRLPDGLHAQEVVAESWPNQSLLDAAVDCVQSWRQSPGHWGAVRSRQPHFGYDMHRGGNGIWYATGIFGNRH